MVNLNIKLPDNFFEAEVKNGFLVSKERKELWGVELDLLQQFKNICDRYHLKYYLDGGHYLVLLDMVGLFHEMMILILLCLEQTMIDF